MRLSYVIPVHNEQSILDETVARLRARLGEHAPCVVFLVENGSRDDSWKACTRLATEERGVDVRALRAPRAGIGYALDLGFREAVALDASPDHWIAFTAADLPFGFSDLEELLSWRLADPSGAAAIGSKDHPRSRVATDWKRRAGSLGYKVLRRAMLGMRTGDPQGTFFLRASLLRELLPEIRARNFFYSTELFCLLERRGIAPHELPVVYEGERRPSSVRFVNDGLTMFGQVFQLRRRLSRSST
jgi:glycosyltransferase involved in cell wall biosynthesis